MKTVVRTGKRRIDMDVVHYNKKNFAYNVSKFIDTALMIPVNVSARREKESRNFKMIPCLVHHFMASHCFYVI